MSTKTVSGTVSMRKSLKIKENFVAPKIDEATRKKIRISENIKADIARKASTVRMG